MTTNKSHYFNAPSLEARQSLDDAWDIWDDAAAMAEVRNWESEVHNRAMEDAWKRYITLKEQHGMRI